MHSKTSYSTLLNIIITIHIFLLPIFIFPFASAKEINTFSHTTYKETSSFVFNKAVIIHKQLINTKKKYIKYKFEYTDNTNISDVYDTLNEITNLYLSYSDNADINNYSSIKDYDTYAIIKINAQKYKREYQESKNTLKQINKLIPENKMKNKSEYEKIRMINDKISEYYTYDYHDYEIIKNNHNISNRTVFTGDRFLKSINSKTAICNSYAETFQYYCLKYHIPCKKITSSEINHAWNVCKVNNKDIFVDVCWNDTTNSKNYLFMNKETNKLTHSENYEKDLAIPPQPVIIKYYKIQYKNAYNNNEKNGSYYRANVNTKFYKPFCKGYVFKGWYYKNKKVSSIRDMNKMRSGKDTIILYAKWKK